MRVVALFGFLILAGCSHTLGYAGQHPGYIKCVGKGVITVSGGQAIGAGMGGGGVNNGTIQADCGDGFQFIQGNPETIGK